MTLRAPAVRLTWTLTTSGDLLRVNHQVTAYVIGRWQDRHGLDAHWDAVLPEYRPQREALSHPDVIRLPGGATAQQITELASVLADVCGTDVHVGRATTPG